MHIQATWRPDWKNEDEYPAAGETCIKQWQWEFLRRLPAYEQDAMKFWKLFEREDNEPGSDYTNERGELQAKYGVDTLIFPWVDFTPGGDASRIAFAGGIEFAKYEEGVISASHFFPGANLVPDGKRRILLPRLESDGDLIIKLNLNNLRQQNERWIREILDKYDSPTPPKRHIRLFPLYLRLLDAEHELSTDEVADHNFLTTFARTCLSSEFESKGEVEVVKKLTSQLESARQYRNGKYRYLSMVQGKDEKPKESKSKTGRKTTKKVAKHKHK